MEGGHAIVAQRGGGGAGGARGTGIIGGWKKGAVAYRGLKMCSGIT